jgi:hypothetical protein
MNPHNARGFCWALLLQEGRFRAPFAPTVIGPFILGDRSSQRKPPRSRESFCERAKRQDMSVSTCRP